MAEAAGIKRKLSGEDLSGEESDDLSCRQPKKPKTVTDDQQLRSLGLSDNDNREPSCNETQGDDPVSINGLPAEILEYIFTFLDIKQRIKAELVCKHWRWVDRNICWTWPRYLVLKAGSRSGLHYPGTELPQLASDHVVSSLLSRCGSNLRKLTLEQKIFASWHSKKTLDIVGKHCTSLMDLTLLNIPLDTKCLEVLAQGCKKLRVLRLAKYGEMYEEDLYTILKGCQALECLHVSAGLNYVTGECFDVVSRNLKFLWVKKCVQLEVFALECLVARCDGMQDLRLTDCSKFDQETLAKVLYHYKDTLKVLHLDRWVPEVNWSKILIVLHHLEELSLCTCYDVHDELCRDLANNCPKLRVLYIRNTDVTDVGLSYLAMLQNLVEVDISFLTLTGLGIKHLAKQNRLEKVYASDLAGLEMADLVFADVVHLCPNLHVLDVSDNEDISDCLVNTVCDALKDGGLKGPIGLGAKNTMVTEDAETCDGLQLLLLDVTTLYWNENDVEYEDELEKEQTVEFIHAYQYVVYGY